MSNTLFDLSRFSYGPVLIGVTFWIFLAIVVLAAIWFAVLRHRETQKTIRLAIEKGMQLDPALIDKLVTRKPAKSEDFYVGGFVCIAVGIGLPILGYFVSRIDPEAFFPITGAGILVGLIGVSLSLVGIVIGRRDKVCKDGNNRV